MGVSVRRSDVETFLECRMQWWYSSRFGQDLESPTLNKALFLGSAVHKALETFYKPRPADTPVPNPADVLQEWGLREMSKAIQQGWDLDVEELNLALILGRSMLDGYRQQWGQTPDDDLDGLRFVDTEIQFEVEIPGTEGGKLSGTADGLCVDRTGQYLIFETKTYTGSPPANQHMNFQTLAYVWAFDTMAREGHPLFERDPTARVYGSVYNGLRKQEPGPRVTKALFVRERVYRSREELARFEQHLAAIYREMTRPDLAIYPTITRSCEWCPFVDPCYSQLSTGDHDWLLETLYRRRVREDVSQT